MDFGIAGVAGITVICYLVGMTCKATEKVKNDVIPVVCGAAGAGLGVVGMVYMPDFPAKDVINALAIGIVSGLAATGVNQAVKTFKGGGQ
ncbi:phage holin family protein [Enterocloster citroniae]|uniref:phage holin family protein n=1 Tax=Enterocloster citroniae TaxID=358743 RepID=UPI001D093805|nr:phage holin family protein [Enterocloster citroniae]MCB7066080.1 phage holin family protein [Enterocloster citroniae]